MSLSRRTFVASGVTAAAGAFSVGWLVRASAERGPNGVFEELGAPVRLGRFHGERVGWNAEGRMAWIYLVFAQAQGEPPFLLVVDPDTGRTDQHHPPVGIRVSGFKSVYPARDGRMYIGTYQQARLLRFDPRRPEAGLEDLGRLEGASMVWWLLEAADGRLYMTTSPDAGLHSWDPADARIRHHARLSEDNAYATVLVADESRRTLFAAVGPDRYDVVRYEVESGGHRGVLAAADRGTGYLGLFAGAGGLDYELPGGERRPVWTGVVDEGPPHRILEGGRTLVAADYEKVVVGYGDGRTETVPLSYDARTEIYTLHVGPDGAVYPFSYAPLRLCRFDEETAEMRVLGNPFATADATMRAAANVDGRMLLAAYPGCDLAIYDPARPWDKGPTPDHNPWTWGEIEAEGHTRPMAMAVGADGLVYVGSDSAYGVSGGAVACLDPARGTLLWNLRAPFGTLSVACVACDPSRPAVFIGCIAGERSGVRGAPVIAWDSATATEAWRATPVQGATNITSLQWHGGALVGTTIDGSDYSRAHVFRLDASSGELLRLARVDLGAVINGNLRPGPDGWFYGLTYADPVLFRVDPRTLSIERIARPPEAHGYGVAVTRRGVYFANGATVTRYRFQEPLEDARN